MSVNKVNSSDGSLSPIATRGQTIQFSAMPTASADYLNRVVQYIGATTTDYTSGYFYRCELVSGSYTWVYVPASTGHTMYPTPDALLTEPDVVDSINSRYNSPTNNEVASVYDISRYSNEKKVRRVLNGANIPSGVSATTTGIGTWTDKDVDQIVSTDEADWWYDDAFKAPVVYARTTDTVIVTGKTYYTESGGEYTPVANPVVGSLSDYYEQYSDDVEVSIKFDPSGDTIVLGGYLYDTTTGKICIRFANSINITTARIAVDITYTRNEVG